LCFDLPKSAFKNATVRLIEPTPTPIHSKIPVSTAELLRGNSKGVIIESKLRWVEITIHQGTPIIVREGINDGALQILIALGNGHLLKGHSSYKSFRVKTLGPVDQNPVELVLNANEPGAVFNGVGGNFRLQNPEKDPQVIDYCLENINVNWGRVEMPWRFWQPDEAEDPLVKARNGEIHPRVRAAMEMAQRLDRLGIPLILSAWSGPNWAIEGAFTFRPQPGGLRGNPLAKDKLEQIYASIGKYVQYIQEVYDVEITMFSFNESDLGINFAKQLKSMRISLRAWEPGLKSGD